MADFYDAFDVRPFTLWLQVLVDSQSAELNRSYVTWSLRIRKDGNSTPWNNDVSPWSVTMAGQNWKASKAYNFSSMGVGSYAIIASGGRMIYHNADGTMAIGVEAWFNDSAGLLDYAFLSGSMTLPSLPRQSTPTFSASSVDIGDPVTINTNRASSSYTHTIKYSFGSSSGTIATGVGTSYVWTPPLSLLNSMTNAAQQVVNITLETYNGSTLIGTKTVSTLTLKAPSEIVPDFTTVTHSEATTGVATNVGKYVQGISKLALAITGAAGAYGSTITTYKITVAGQTINAASGTTTALQTSGASVPIVATITDSRGRTKSKTVNVEVLAYAPPTITSVAARRSLGGGTLDDNGTFIRVDLNAAVQSLMNTTQRNALVYKLYSRLSGTSTWTLQNTVTPGGIAFNGFSVMAGTYAVEDSYDVRVEVIDDFSTSVSQLLVPQATIFMHWDESLGVGILKYRENGALDVGGAIYGQRIRLTDTGDVSLSSTGHAFQIGPDNNLNLVIDQNEIQGRNNGAAAGMSINAEGGDVTIGDAASTVTVPGRLSPAHLPWAMAAGSLAILTPLNNGASVSGTITLPASRFTQTPVIVLGSSSSRVGMQADTRSTTSFRLLAGNFSGASASAGVGDATIIAFWSAIQMTSSSASG